MLGGIVLEVTDSADLRLFGCCPTAHHFIFVIRAVLKFFCCSLSRFFCFWCTAATDEGRGHQKHEQKREITFHQTAFLEDIIRNVRSAVNIELAVAELKIFRASTDLGHSERAEVTAW